MMPVAIDVYAGGCRTPDDIDVYAGGLLEQHSAGSQISDLFKAITAEQFLKLKVGDRFWYELGDQDGAFTLGEYVTSCNVS